MATVDRCWADCQTEPGFHCINKQDGETDPLQFRSFIIGKNAARCWRVQARPEGHCGRETPQVVKNGFEEHSYKAMKWPVGSGVRVGQEGVDLPDLRTEKSFIGFYEGGRDQFILGGRLEK